MVRIFIGVTLWSAQIETSILYFVTVTFGNAAITEFLCLVTSAKYTVYFEFPPIKIGS